MRPIKFRAWDKENNKMVELTSPHWERDGVMAMFGQIPFGSKVELMQYTGLLDKNGKEIYEGDIIKVDNEQREYFVDMREVGEVSFDCGGFNFGNNSQERMLYLIRAMDTRTALCEIIGNIYENPELLK